VDREATTSAIRINKCKLGTKGRELGNVTYFFNLWNPQYLWNSECYGS